MCSRPRLSDATLAAVVALVTNWSLTGGRGTGDQLRQAAGTGPAAAPPARRWAQGVGLLPDDAATGRAGGLLGGVAPPVGGVQEAGRGGEEGEETT